MMLKLKSQLLKNCRRLKNITFAASFCIVFTFFGSSFLTFSGSGCVSESRMFGFFRLRTGIMPRYPMFIVPDTMPEAPTQHITQIVAMTGDGAFTTKIEKIENVVNCVTILDCNYRKKLFLFRSFLFECLFL